MSTMWSDYPAVSARGATQFIATTVVGIVAGSCIKPRSLLSALLGALSLVAVFSVLYGGKTAIGLTGEIGLLGIFGSKNYFGLTISFLLLTSVIVWADRLQPRLFRLIGMAGALAAPLLLIQAKSTGAIVVSLTTGLLMLACYVGFRLLPQFRATLIIVGALCIVMFTIFGTLNIDESQDALGLFGKDVTLTGRTYLWEYAIRSVADNPALGVGYQAYWVPENLYAQELWRHAGVGPGGFHFHNTYLQVAVDLGLIGLFVLLATFTAIARRVVATIVGPRPSPEQLFAITAFIFMLLRTPIEVDLFFQFQLSTIFLCLCWIYLQPRARIARAAEVS
jgi:exopolysaccharide production protein ExoQ